MTGIIRNRNAFSLTVVFHDIVCQSLCCLANCINIHTVCSRADDASQSCSTELQIHVKSFLYFIFILFDTFKLRSRIFIKV